MNDETVLKVTFQGALWERVQRVRHVEGVLCAQYQIQQQPPREREDQEALRVGLPILLALGVHAQHPVQRPLKPADHGSQENALARVYLRHIAAERQGE
jgi:hypothetical protein